MQKWPSFGERIKERLVYRWIGGSTPDHDNIIKLARELECHPCWLMFGNHEGEGGQHATTGAPVAPLAPVAVPVLPRTRRRPVRPSKLKG